MRHTLLLAQERLERDEFVQALTILELGQKWALTKPQFFTFGSQSNDPNPSTLEKIVLRQIAAEYFVLTLAPVYIARVARLAGDVGSINQNGLRQVSPGKRA